MATKTSRRVPPRFAFARSLDVTSARCRLWSGWASTRSGILRSKMSLPPRRLASMLAYPMQFMLNIYEFADDSGSPSAPDLYPKTFVVERFRGYRPVAGPAARSRAFPAPGNAGSHETNLSIFGDRCLKQGSRRGISITDKVRNPVRARRAPRDCQHERSDKSLVTGGAFLQFNGPLERSMASRVRLVSREQGALGAPRSYLRQM